MLPRSTQRPVGRRASRRRAAELARRLLGCRCQPALCAAAWPPPAIGAAAAQNCACVLGQASGGTVRARAYLGRHRWDTDRTGAGGWSLNPRRWTSARRFSSAVLARSAAQTAPQEDRMGVTHEGEISGSGRNTGEVLTHSPSCASPAGRPYLAQLLAAYLPEALAGAPHLVGVRLRVELSRRLSAVSTSCQNDPPCRDA